MQRTITLGEDKIILQTRTIKEAISLIDNLDISVKRNEDDLTFTAKIKKKGYAFYCVGKNHTLKKL
jgi:hypothetical protein